MAIKRKNRDWGALIDTLAGLSKSYKACDKRLHAATAEFCELLKTVNISHSSKNSSGKTWGAKSLSICFCEIFDPILIETFPIDSCAYQHLQKKKISIPLLKHLQHKKNIQNVANSINQVIFELESLIPIGAYNTQYASAKPSDWAKIQKDTENLQLISRLLAAIHSQLGFKCELKWCDICFRMANTSSDYCQLHSSKNDTAYRKALQVRKLIPFDLLEKFYRQNSKREALSDSFTIAAYSEEFTARIKLDTSVIYVDKVIKDLVDETLNFEWPAVSKNWDLILETTPHVSKRYEKKAIDFTNWQQFVSYSKTVLDNHNDDTQNPYWIIMMLAEAELWLSFEEELAHKKVRPKKDEVIKLIAKGMRNCEIINQIKVSNSYVSELRTKYNKNRTTN